MMITSNGHQLTSYRALFLSDYTSTSTMRFIIYGAGAIGGVIGGTTATCGTTALSGATASGRGSAASGGATARGGAAASSAAVGAAASSAAVGAAASCATVGAAAFSSAAVGNAAPPGCTRSL